MPIDFHPTPRMVLMCNFDTGFREPEMTKVRPVVIMSPQRHNRETCIVVPMSTTEPDPVQAFHHRMDELSLPRRLRRDAHWIKGDMVTTVGTWRLDRVRDKRVGFSRTYVAQNVTFQDWVAIEKAVAIALGWGSRGLTF